MLDRALAGLTLLPFLLGGAGAPVDHAQVAFSFQDPEIVESSGLAVVDGLVVTTNDSGDLGRVFTVDPATGRTVASTVYDADAVDVEALAPDGHGGVWTGDIGDNNESRHSVRVTDIPVGADSAAVDDQQYDLAYPDGPHDAETLMSDPTTGRLYVATKGVLGGTLYAAPAHLARDHVNRLEPLGDVLPIATDGAFLPDGKHLVVRNYAVAVVYAFPSLERVDELRLPAQPQGEGLAVDADGSLLLSSEGLHSDVLRVALPAPEPTSSPSPTPSSTSSASAASPGTHTESREDSELPASAESHRSAWPWLLTGLLAIGFVLVLTRSLRRR
jgi:hypothetical protein